MNWLRKLFHICEHRWQIYKEIGLIDDDHEMIGTKFVLQCEKCGNLKTKRV